MNIKEKRIENLLENVDYIVQGTESGWLNIKDTKLIQMAYMIKLLSNYTYNELFYFEDKGYKIN